VHEDAPAGAQSRGKEGQRDAHYGREVCALLVRNAAEAMCRACGGAAMRRSTMLKTCDTRRFATAAAFTHAAEPRKTLWQTCWGMTRTLTYARTHFPQTK